MNLIKKQTLLSIQKVASVSPFNSGLDLSKNSNINIKQCSKKGIKIEKSFKEILDSYK